MRDLPVDFISGWMQPVDTEKWKKKIVNNIEWTQPKVKVYGKEYFVPRKTCFIGDKNIRYSYSGFVHQSNGWPDWFYPLLEKVSFACQSNFNGCLINLYRNGSDRMGWHSDNEKELDPKQPISSLSLGATRDFCVKHREHLKKGLFTLKNGDLLIMKPSFQEYWLHSIPIRKKVIDYRINLTFRCYLND